MNQPRVTNQVSLYRENKWVGEPTSQTPTIGDAVLVANSVYVVDLAIKRMMESEK